MKIEIIANGFKKSDYLIKRWGLSILINEDILFDTFSDPEFLMLQIQEKQIDIKKIKHIILSHEHWDHINGLWSILEQNPQVTVYFGKHFTSEFKEKVKTYKTQIIEIEQSIKVYDNVFTTPEFCGNYKNQALYESGLVVKTPKGLVLFTGCAHPKLAIMINAVIEQFGDNLYLLVGGFHLSNSDHNEIRELINYLHQKGIQKIMPLHCTGEQAEKLIKQSFGENYIQNLKEI